MAETGSRAELIGPFPERLGDEPEARDHYDRMRRRVLWAMPSGLYLVGSAALGQRNLMTARWVMQMSVVPKLVGVSVECNALTNKLIAQGHCFSASCILRSDRAVVRRFVKPADEGPEPGQLGGIEVRSAVTGAPIPVIAAAWVDCRLTEMLELGSHTLFLGEVVDAGGTTEVEDALLRLEDTRMSYGG